MQELIRGLVPVCIVVVLGYMAIVAIWNYRAGIEQDLVLSIQQSCRENGYWLDKISPSWGRGPLKVGLYCTQADVGELAALRLQNNLQLLQGMD